MKILTAFACVLSINVASAELVVYEGTATIRGIGVSSRPKLPFTAVGGDEFRFRAIVDTATPGHITDDGIGDIAYAGAVLSADFWIRGTPILMPPIADTPKIGGLGLPIPLIISSVRVSNDILDEMHFSRSYAGIDGLRYSFRFMIQDINGAMLSSDAIPTEIDYNLSSTQFASFWTSDDSLRGIYEASMITMSFTITPLSVVNLLQDLRTASEGVGPGKSLANKVILAQTYYAVPDLVSTCAVLGEYVLHTAHKKVTPATGAALRDDAQLIASAIGCE